jgi:hypothetical protein
MVTTLSEFLATVVRQDARGWLYLPKDRPWGLQSEAAVFVNDEVPPDEEGLPDAGIPEAARRAGLMPVLPVSVVQEIVFNATAQVPNADGPLLLKALLHYYDTDAFADFT